MQRRLFLGYGTAFWIWRKIGSLGLNALAPARTRSLKGGAPTATTVDSFRKDHPDLVTDPLDVLVQTGGNRTVPNVKTHIHDSPYPERSFYRLDDGVYVASPELCLMQMASKLTIAEAAKLAIEMCGSYAIDPLYDEPGLLERPALTSAAKIRRYASKIYRPESRAHPTKFLSKIIDGSASPRETALFMLLCMPPKLGGYGIAMPEMNGRIELGFEDRLVSGKAHYRCDLLWRDRQCAVEYDSARFHTPQEKQEQDALRRNMLEHNGIRMITATREQLNHPGKFDRLARQIAHATGKRLRIPEKAHVEARTALRKTLFDWDAIASDPRQRHAGEVTIPGLCDEVD